MGSRAITGRDPNGLDGCSTRAIDGRVTSDLDEEDTINIDVDEHDQTMKSISRLLF